MRRDRGNRRSRAIRRVGTLEPTHSVEGVDLTLIRWMLSMSPLDRLATLQATIESIRRLRGEAAEN